MKHPQTGGPGFLGATEQKNLLDEVHESKGRKAKNRPGPGVQFFSNFQANAWIEPASSGVAVGF